MKKKITGFQRKFLIYTGGLLLIAILLSSVGVWYYMRKNMMGIVTDQYGFRNEKSGMALDNLFQTSDKALEECILNDQVQESLKAKPLAEVDRNSLSKYFAYINLDAVSEYCYVDNKQNIYTRSYSKLTYDKFATSGLLEHLGNSYANTVWFLAKDTLFGNGEQALFLGRKVHSLEYAHEPGYLFLKMDSSFLNSVREMGDSVSNEAAIGVLDAEGTVCAAWCPKSFSMSRSTLTRLRELATESRSGVVAQSENVAGGMLFAYRQAETGFTVFTIVPEHVLTKGSRQVVLVLLVIYLFVIAFAGVLSIYFSKRITKPIRVISKAMTEFDAEEKAEPIHLNTKTELDQIGNSYNKMVSNTQELLAEIKVQQQELRTSELNMLISQINPHFLYNTLDTIYMLARINKEETTMKMIQSLSKYLRLSLSKGSDIVTVADELENVKSYLQIQEIRNENLFTYTVDCGVDAEQTWVLKLILQPLVENAIKHGFCEIYEGGIIQIRVYEEDEFLVLSVFNNGKPIDQETAERINALNDKPISEAKNCFPNQKNGYGVTNVLTRLRLKYGKRVQYRYEAQEDGTLCMIQIPGKGECENG